MLICHLFCGLDFYFLFFFFLEIDLKSVSSGTATMQFHLPFVMTMWVSGSTDSGSDNQFNAASGSPDVQIMMEMECCRPACYWKKEEKLSFVWRQRGPLCAHLVKEGCCYDTDRNGCSAQEWAVR